MKMVMLINYKLITKRIKKKLKNVEIRSWEEWYNLKDFDVIVLNLFVPPTKKKRLNLTKNIFKIRNKLHSIIEKDKVIIIIDYKKCNVGKINLKGKFINTNYDLIKKIDIPIQELSSDIRFYERKINCIKKESYFKKYFKDVKIYRIIKKEKNKVTTSKGHSLIYETIATCRDEIVACVIQYSNSKIIFLPKSLINLKNKIDCLYKIGKYYLKRKISEEIQRPDLKKIKIECFRKDQKVIIKVNGKEVLPKRRGREGKKKNYNIYHIKILDALKEGDIVTNKLIERIFGNNLENKSGQLNTLITELRQGLYSVRISKSNALKIINKEKGKYGYVSTCLKKRQIYISSSIKS